MGKSARSNAVAKAKAYRQEPKKKKPVDQAERRASIVEAAKGKAKQQSNSVGPGRKDLDEAQLARREESRRAFEERKREKARQEKEKEKREEASRERKRTARREAFADGNARRAKIEGIKGQVQRRKQDPQPI
jgi:hypothetical protein